LSPIGQGCALAVADLTGRQASLRHREAGAGAAIRIDGRLSELERILYNEPIVTASEEGDQASRRSYGCLSCSSCRNRLWAFPIPHLFSLVDNVKSLFDYIERDAKNPRTIVLKWETNAVHGKW